MKIALFQDIQLNDITPVLHQPNYGTDEERENYTVTGYVRISEWIDIEFPPLSTDEVIQSQLKVIDEAEQEARRRFNEQLERFNGMRANLLALPAPIAA